MKEKSYAEIADKGKDIGANILSQKDLQIVKWQRMAMLCCVITLLSVASLVYVSTKATFIPYLVGMDETTGRIQSLGALTEVNQEPTEAQKAYFLHSFVEQIRSIPADNEVMKSNMSRATKFLTQQSGNKLKDLYLNDMTQNIIAGKINRVKVLSVTKIANSDNGYQVRWEEIQPDNGRQTINSFTGTFTLTREPVSDKEVLVDNPLGLFIKDFTIADEGKVDNQLNR